MRSRSAIFVDAGYLIAATATRITGSSLRRGISMNYEKVVQVLIGQVLEDSGLPLLRVYWYDAARGGVPDSDQRGIADLENVKVRLGRTGVDGEQKGVDLRIGLDMVSHSRNRAVDSIYLLSGDDDLTEAVEEAQAQGVRVIVLTVPGTSGAPHAVSRNLMRAADGVLSVDGPTLDSCAEISVSSVPATPLVRPHVATNKRAPSPMDLARKQAPQYVPDSKLVYTSGSGDQAHAGAHHALVSEDVLAAMDKVVDKGLSAWWSSSTSEQRRELVRGRPTIPPDLDRVLLVDLADALEDYNLSNDVRAELRTKLWEQIDKEGLLKP